MHRFVAAPALFLALAGCAGHAPAPALSDTSTARLQSTYSCVVNAFISAGYPMRARGFPQPTSVALKVTASITEPGISDTDPRLAGTDVSRSGRAGSGTAYAIDIVDASITVDSTGATHVDAVARTGVGLSADSGYLQRPSSARGDAAVATARACEEH